MCPHSVLNALWCQLEWAPVSVMKRETSVLLTWFLPQSFRSLVCAGLLFKMNELIPTQEAQNMLIITPAKQEPSSRPPCLPTVLFDRTPVILLLRIPQASFWKQWLDL